MRTAPVAVTVTFNVYDVSKVPEPVELAIIALVPKPLPLKPVGALLPINALTPAGALPEAALVVL